MPIPAFDNILNVLPPHLGDPTNSADLSPYACSIIEVCNRFTTSPERKAILVGFLNLRREMFNLGLNGFQWLDGSFVEDIEARENRSPRDIDVVTFIDTQMDIQALDTHIRMNKPSLLSRQFIKATFSVDHFVVPLCSSPSSIVEQTRYWCGLFSHRRGDGLWKGMLKIDLDPSDDAAAMAFLGGWQP